MTICKIVLEFTRVDQASDPYAFRYAPQDYLLRTPGGGFEEATLDWGDELLADLQQVQQPGRDPAVLHRIGEELRKFLAPAGWGIHEQTILRAVREGTPVYLTVRSAAAELYTLPWELLTIKSTGQLIGSMPGVLIRYEWPGTQSAPSRGPLGGGRVMVAWSAAAGPVPSDEHTEAIHQADLGQDYFAADRDIIANATFSQIAAAIDQAERGGPPVRVLHLLCHGAAHGSTFGLALDGDSPEDGLVVVDAGRLQQLLAPHADMIRLVVLSACDSGNTGELGNHLGSVAQMLHRAGIAAVVASRFPLSVAGSERLTKALYQELCSPGGTVENAFLAARRALSHDARQLDWASIQLYARESDGLLGALLAPPEPSASTDANPAGAEQSFTYPSVLTPRKNTYVDIILGLGAVSLVVGLVLFFVFKSQDQNDPDEPTDQTQISLASDSGTKPQAPPKPESTSSATTTETDTDEDSTTSAEDTTTGAEPQSGSTTAVVKKTPQTTRKPPSTGKCPDRLLSQVKSAFHNTGAGSQRISMKLTVEASGNIKVTSASGSNNAKKLVQQQLGQFSASSIKRKGDGKLPCKMSHTWIL